jgi:hypothetical protein
MMLDLVVGRLGRRLWGVIGLSSTLVVGCGPQTDEGEGADATDGMSPGPGPHTEGPTTASGGPGSGSGSGSSASGSASGSEPETASASETTSSGNDCGANVMETVCVDPEGGSSEGTTGGNESGGTTIIFDDTGGSEGSGDPKGLCDGVSITDDQGYCIYDTSEVFVQDGLCCAVLSGTEHCCDGRPFFVGGHARTAVPVERAEWAAPLTPAVLGLTDAERDALAGAWCDDGLMEHASVASFARFALQLVAVGAPPQLLVDTQQAIRDEIEHARLCFGLASAYAGRKLGPGPLGADGSRRRRRRHGARRLHRRDDRCGARRARRAQGP